MKQSIIASSPTVLCGKSKFSPNTVVQWLGALRFFYRDLYPKSMPPREQSSENRYSFLHRSASVFPVGAYTYI
jgi:hypothetical protein